MTFQDRIRRVSLTSHVVYTDDMTVHRVAGINSLKDEIYVQAADGMVFRDVDVFTLEEAANMERVMLKLYKEFGIKY